MRCLDVHIKLAVGDPCQIVSGTSAKANRAVMQAQNPHALLSLLK